MEAQSEIAIPPRLVLYDGECGFCDRLVQWLLGVDDRDRFRFAPLQGTTAAEVRVRHPTVGDDLDTMLFVETTPEGSRVYVRSRAFFRVCTELPGVWRFFGWFRVLPRFLTDLGYRAFAAMRYRLFGRLEACRVPDPAQAHRFLP